MTRTLSTLFLIVCFVSGCGQDGNKTSPVRTAEIKTPPSPPAIEMKTTTLRDLLDKHIAAQKGKVVVVDLWAFFCVPCKAEFPNLVKLHHEFADKGVVCMSLSLDFNEPLKQKALEFLKKEKAVFANYWLEDQASAGMHWDFEAVPAVVVYDRDGKLARVFNNDKTFDPKVRPFSYEADVVPLVKKLLETK